ncbi:hypothetical protein RHECNPAF_890021 [Rhizobium etli CNPAF512]|nr:hypothetical protein RHECNPAF_890021 [Rhizobium etli CNPAF512]
MLIDFTVLSICSTSLGLFSTPRSCLARGTGRAFSSPRALPGRRI